MEEMFSFYEVGGKVRDELLGLTSKDVDYVAVPNNTLIKDISSAHTMFGILKGYLETERFEIFLVTDSCFTIRARFPQGHKYHGVADFVMARKETGYIPGTRQPIIVAGTLYDDLERRDFTLNALARNHDGSIIDYFNGLEDLQNRVLRTPLDTEVTFNDDPLRILRAIRFSIVKGFSIPNEMSNVIRNFDYKNKFSVVSMERIREELIKCLKHDTLKTLHELNRFPNLRDYIFKNNLMWLKPTMEL